ncbi:hypothetical protein M8013_22645 [Enterobacteriaceae bacterium H4N4]|uniref:Uncharacterized protein n=1 Tax=Silvania confinis TaxID=2926470 RepID=A0A9J6QQ62_9ENTR|nr:hypothetical protein [Silvania confinis]MCU6671522.1 hypothetical protein [Silvania confinis]
MTIRSTSPYTLHELLCMFVFLQNRVYPQDTTYRQIVGWAENRVMAGDDSEPLLILASLGLQTEPARHEVTHWLERYLVEQQLVWPDARMAALVWLRIFLDDLLTCNDIATAEQRLETLALHELSSPMVFFDACASQLRSCYWDLFDDWGGERICPATEMGTTSFLVLLRDIVMPWHHKLSCPDWREWLTR